MKHYFSNKTLLCLVSVVILAVGCIWGGHSVFAQGVGQDFTGINYQQNSGLASQDIRYTIANIIRIIMGFLGTIALLITLYGGFVFMTAGGETDKVEKGKLVLRNGLIGLGITLASYGIAAWVLHWLGGATGLVGGDGGSGCVGAECSGLPSGGGANRFTVSSLSPKGELAIRNVVVRVFFNRNIEPTSIRNKISVISLGVDGVTVGSEVPGVYNVNGRKVEFIPAAACPDPNADRKCFDRDNWYQIKVAEGVVASEQTQQQENVYRTDGGVQVGGDTVTGGFGSGVATSVCLVSGATNNCMGKFKTGNIVDVGGPFANIYKFDPSKGNSIPQGTAASPEVGVYFTLEDSGGIAYANIESRLKPSQNQIDNGSAPGYQGIGLYEPVGDVLNFVDDFIPWNTSSLELQSVYQVRVEAWDVDSNSGISEVKEVKVRPLYCFNNQLDADKSEQNIDCGGACGCCQGDVGCCQSDLDCASGICVEGMCINSPQITALFPRDGAPGTFLTIYGKGFGNKKGKGLVRFLGSDLVGDEVEAVYPAGDCSDSWHDVYIVVQVPAGAVSGALYVKTDLGLWDESLDLGDAGVFQINEKKRPGICKLTPASGEPFGKVNVYGKNFGQDLSRGKIRFGSAGTKADVWQDTFLEGAVVPPLNAGQNLVTVEVTHLGQTDPLLSNAVPFDVLESTTLPHIDYISPNSGPKSQYVTLFGSNFGQLTGMVNFHPSNDPGRNILADTDFPQVCGADFWHNSYVTIKVPQAIDSLGAFTVSLITSEGKTSNEVVFAVNNNPPTPGVCKIEPDNGPWGIGVSMYGENFGLREGQAKVKYWDKVEVVDYLNWDQGEVRGNVPPNAVTGRVELVDSSGTRSNQVNFSVGECQADSCQVGQQCCSDGSCRDQCEESKALCSYKWQFTTGNGCACWPCLEDADCGCPANPTPDNPCLVCVRDRNAVSQCLSSTKAVGCLDQGSGNAGDGACLATCSQDGDCAAGSTCDCYFDAQRGGQLCICKDKTPRVIEDVTCSQDTQIPTPYFFTKDQYIQDPKNLACGNAIISARFTQDMDESTFVFASSQADQVDSSIVVKECNSGDNINLGSCQIIGGKGDIINQGNVGEGFSFIKTNSGGQYLPLNVNTWYQVLIKGGDTQTMVVSSAEGVIMSNDYVWVFKTGADTFCEPKKIMVSPQARTFTWLTDTQTFGAVAVAENCNMLWFKDAAWLWDTQNNLSVNGFPYIKTSPLFPNDLTKYPDKQTARPSVTPQVDTLVDQPAKVTTQFCRGNKCPVDLKGSADITVAVNPSDGVPRVIIQRECGNNTQSPSPFIDNKDACINAEISARFTEDMDDQRLLNPDLIVFEKCNQGGIFDSNICQRIQTGVEAMRKVGNNNHPGEGFVFTPGVDLLASDTWYSVTILSGENGMRSSWNSNLNRGNIPLADDFVWKFKTKKSSQACRVDRVLVTPPEDLVTKKNDQAVYFGSPLAANCNILRGDYVWDWKTSDGVGSILAPQDSRVVLLSPAERAKPIYGDNLVNNGGFDNQDLGWGSVNGQINLRQNRIEPLSRNFVMRAQSFASQDTIFQNIKVLGTIAYRLKMNVKLISGAISVNIVSSLPNWSWSPVTAPILSENYQDWNEIFTAPVGISDIRLQLIFAPNTVAYLDSISVQEIINGTDSIALQAKQVAPNDNPVNIKGTLYERYGGKEIGGDKYDISQLVILFDKPYVTGAWPNCQSACMNAEVGGQFNLVMDEPTLNSDNIKLYKCTDQTCNPDGLVLCRYGVISQTVSITGRNDGGVLSGSQFVDVSEFSLPLLSSQCVDANNYLLNDSWYRVVVQGGNNGVKSTEGMTLSQMNFDNLGGQNFTAYSWVFSTANDNYMCKVTHVKVDPAKKQLFLIGARQDYVAKPYGDPDACNVQGQRINPYNIAWNWLSDALSDKDALDDTLVSKFVLEDGSVGKRDIFPKDPLTGLAGDGRIDPVQTIETTGQGEAVIKATAMPDLVSGQGDLKVTCGFSYDDQCFDSSILPPQSSIDYWGVSADSCCYQRPRVVVHTDFYIAGDVVPANIKLIGGNNNTRFPIPALNAGFVNDFAHPNPGSLDKVCKNALVLAQFDQKMDYNSVLENVKVWHKNNAVVCPGDEVSDGAGWCQVAGDLQITYSGGGSVVEFVPKVLFLSDTIYKVEIKGGVFQTDNGHENIKQGVISESGIAMDGDFVWEFWVSDKVCTIDHVDVLISRDNDPLKLENKDNFSCGKVDDCPDDVFPVDIAGTNSGNQHKYTPLALDISGQALLAKYEWVKKEEPLLSGTEVLTSCSKASVCPGEIQTEVCNSPLLSKLSLGGDLAVTAQNNGSSVLTVLATGCGPETGVGSNSVEASVFLCANPWPPIGYSVPNQWHIWQDIGAADSSNFGFFYCRDSGAPGPWDDLPGISNIVEVPHGVLPDNIVTNPNCSNVADYVCGEDGNTYLNRCVLSQSGGYYLKDGRCNSSIIKEYLFFVDVPDNIVRNDACLGDPADYICASDGRTYYNDCVLGKYNQANNPDVSLVNRGICPK